MEDVIYDVVIIGGGPAGLTAAQYAARAKMKTVVLDKSKAGGSLAYASLIENYPGILKPMTGKELLDLFREQAVSFGAEYVETQVLGVSSGKDIKEVYTLQRTYQTKTVIIATGAMGRKASIRGETEFLGRGVSYCATCDAAFFRDRIVCVLGDSEEAVREAGYLARFVAQVHLITPTSKLRAQKDHPALREPNLSVMTGLTVTAIEGTDTVEKVKLRSSDGEERELPVSGVFVYLHGTKPVVDFLQESVKTGENECIITDRTMETSAPGFFAAGDVTCTDVRQVVVAAAHGCRAALAADRFITGRKKMRSDWHG